MQNAVAAALVIYQQDQQKSLSLLNLFDQDDQNINKNENDISRSNFILKTLITSIQILTLNLLRFVTTNKSIITSSSL